MNEYFCYSIINELSLLTFMPGEYIIREGEVGKEMYFINEGQVEVVIVETGKVVNRLKVSVCSDF